VFFHRLSWRLVFFSALSSVPWLLDIPPCAAHLYSVSLLFFVLIVRLYISQQKINNLYFLQAEALHVKRSSGIYYPIGHSSFDCRLLDFHDHRASGSSSENEEFGTPNPQMINKTPS
jgi:hypothetical protein